jgi:hypothetical protein
VQTPDEEYRTTGVVIATGNLNVPRVPPIAQQLADDIDQRHASPYRNAAQLPPGGVLVIGGAQSGCQIAEDVVANGRRVYLSTCDVGRLPWRYRGRDTVEWLIDAGFYDQRPEDLEDPAAMRLAQPVVASGGRDLSVQMLSRSGVTLLGHLASIDDGIATFDDSTAANIAFADEFARRIRTTVDNFIERSGATGSARAGRCGWRSRRHGGTGSHRPARPRYRQCHLVHWIHRRLLLAALADPRRRRTARSCRRRNDGVERLVHWAALAQPPQLGHPVRLPRGRRPHRLSHLFSR